MVKKEPRIVKTFRIHYPDSLYLHIWDNGIKIRGMKKHEADKTWLLRNMKEYRRLRREGKVYDKEVK